MQFSHFRYIRVFFENGPSASSVPSLSVSENIESNAKTASEGVEGLEPEEFAKNLSPIAERLIKGNNESTINLLHSPVRSTPIQIGKITLPSTYQDNIYSLQSSDPYFNRSSDNMNSSSDNMSRRKLSHFGNTNLNILSGYREQEKSINQVIDSFSIALESSRKIKEQYLSDFIKTINSTILQDKTVSAEILNSLKSDGFIKEEGDIKVSLSDVLSSNPELYDVLLTDKKYITYIKGNIGLGEIWKRYNNEHDTFTAIKKREREYYEKRSLIEAKIKDFEIKNIINDNIVSSTQLLSKDDSLYGVLQQKNIHEIKPAELVKFKEQLMSAVFIGNTTDKQVQIEEIFREYIKLHLAGWKLEKKIDSSITEETPIEDFLKNPVIADILMTDKELFADIFAVRNPEVKSNLSSIFEGLSAMVIVKDIEITNAKNASIAEADANKWIDSSMGRSSAEFDAQIKSSNEVVGNGKSTSVSGNVGESLGPILMSKEVSSNTLSNDWALKDAIESGLPVRLTGTDIVVHKVNDTTLSVKGCGDEWPAHKADEIPGLFRRIEACASIPFLRNHFLPAGGTFFTDIYDKINHDPALLHLKDPTDGMVPSYKFAAILMDIFGEMGKAQITDEKLGKIQVVPGKNQRYPENFASLKEYNSAQFSNYNTTTDNILDLAKKAPSSQLVKNGVIQPAAFFDYFQNNITF